MTGQTWVPAGVGDDGDDSRSPAALARDVLVQEWAGALRTTAYVPMSPTDIEHYLRDLADRLVTAVSDPAGDVQVATDVGARLVAANFTGEKSLSCTLEILARALPATAGIAEFDRSGSRVVELLSAVGAGYTQALRDRTFDQQEDMWRALLHVGQEVERDLLACEARFHEVFDSSPMGVILSEPGGRIVRTNRSLDERLGYACGELLGRELNGLFADEPDEPAAAQQRYQRLLNGQESRLRIRSQLRRRTGEPLRIQLAVSVLRDTEQRPLYLATMIDDVAELNLLKKWLKHQTLHDLQTGLPNRQYFISHLEQVLGLLEPSAVITLLHLDLDGFSAINDGLGYRFGDRVLDVVGQRLRKVVAGHQAMVARIGGDEFAILIEPGDRVPRVGALAEAINNELAEPVYLGKTGMAVTATIGAVQQRAAGMDHAELLRAAGATLRRLVGKGKRQWGMFDTCADTAGRAKLQLAAALPGALETGELRVTYQPMVTLEDIQLVGVEVALSWRHPELGMLSHERCVHAAEQTGVVYALGQWLLRAAADQAVSWRQRFGACVPPVAVNLTPLQAQDPDLVATVRAVLDQTGLPAAGLELRAPVAAIRTSSGVLADDGGATAEDNLQVLAELGVRMGLCEFGGGIGGLRCLADLPVNAVQVAEPISLQVAADPSRILSQAVHALVHIVRSSGINVIAYPVNCSEQAACWPWVGANWGVGDLFGPAGPPENIELLLAAQADTS
ncbi:MAG: putative bifunctional diguanylate cyclase/phosphodiesterase [Pseudonocardiaceae bacterium]